MKIELVSKNYTMTDNLKEVITKKVAKLDKFFETDTRLKVLCKQVKDSYVMELTIGAGDGILRAEVAGDNMYDNIDFALPKLEKQIIRHHQKLADKSKKFRAKEVASSVPAGEIEKHRMVVKSKTFALTPMTVGDAVEELELVGHDFFVFLNKATNNINVLYKRVDEDYGLIETTI